MDRIKTKTELPHSAISEIIIGCCFEIMRELGSGFLENIYKNALFIAMKQKGISVGLLINFGQQKLEYKRLHHPNELDEVEQLRQKIHALMRSDEQT